MASTNTILIPSLTLEEILSDGSTLSNPVADHRRLFLGEDGFLHCRDSAGNITDPYPGSGSVATDAIWDAAGDLAVGTGANTAARVAIGANLSALRSNGTTAVWSSRSGEVVQVKTAVLSSDHSTTAVTMQDSGLSLAFTPLFTDSILHVAVDGEVIYARAAGSPQYFQGWLGITNSTDAVELVRQVRGHVLIAASSAAATAGQWAIGLAGRYTVNSLTARTFKLQHMSAEVTNIQSTIKGTRTGGVTMTITEVRP